MNIYLHIDVPWWACAMIEQGRARAFRRLGHEAVVRTAPPPDGTEPDLVLVSFCQLVRQDPERYYDLGERAHVWFRSHWEVRALNGDERLVLDRVNVWANNRQLAEQASAKLGRPVPYRRDGIPTDIYTPSLLDRLELNGGPKLFTVGWSGNAELACKQWPVAERVGRAVVEMGGRFEARGRGLRDWPCLPLQEMPRWFRGLSCYICTSIEDAGPSGPLEAAACGVPTVSFRLPMMQEFIIDGTTGYLVDDEQEMIEHLGYLKRDRSGHELSDMRRDARLRAEEWSMDNWCRDFLQEVQ